MRLFPISARSVALAVMLAGSALGPIAASHGAPAAKSPPPYVNKREGFAISLPGKPKMGSRVANLPNGKTMKANFYSVAKPPLTYIVIPVRLPGTPKGAQIDQFLNGVQLGFTRRAGIKLLSSKKIRLQNYPGREVLLQAGTNLTRVRYFVAGSRSFQVLAISPQNGADKYRAQISKVLDSFRILS